MLILSILLAAKAMVDVAVWKVMGPAMPALMRVVGRTPQPPFMPLLMAYLTPIKLGQAALWTAIGVTAASLLRLRPWARVAMQGVGWMFIAYLAALEVIFAGPGRGFRAPPARSLRRAASSS